ncbi:hypothetical protein ACTHQ6_09365 [Arthrobacter sp. SAFR-179]|uniref:hypothetical protein n=1 Tax=Arthrobacter sp. SAFR-179 TaxID=3387279 RepID=UPI003F7B4942
MPTDESIEAAEYYAETLRAYDRVNSAYKRNEASRADLDAAWFARVKAFENLKRLEQAAASEREHADD